MFESKARSHCPSTSAPISAADCFLFTILLRYLRQIWWQVYTGNFWKRSYKGWKGALTTTITTQAIPFGSMLNKNVHYDYLLIQLALQVLRSPPWWSIGLSLVSEHRSDPQTFYQLTTDAHIQFQPAEVELLVNVSLFDKPQGNAERSIWRYRLPGVESSAGPKRIRCIE